MEERAYIVYKHTSPSGKVYIGITKQTANARWKNGLGYQSSPHFWKAIQKYGWDSFSHEVLRDGLTREEACAEEQRLIREFDSMNSKFGYNLRAGGQTGAFASEYVRRKMSKSKTAFYAAHPEARKELSDRVTGFRHSEETKQKMREAAKNRHYVLTYEWKQNIGKANKERILSDEKLYAEICVRCKQNGLSRSRPVVQLDRNGNYIAEYESGKSASRETGIADGNIQRCCKGSISTAGGYKWLYANEYNGGREIA